MQGDESASGSETDDRVAATSLGIGLLRRSSPATPMRLPGLPLVARRLNRLYCGRTRFAVERLLTSAENSYVPGVRAIGQNP